MGTSLSCFNSEALPHSARGEKVVVITGCDSGFGQQLALHAAHVLGFKVVAACLSVEGEKYIHDALQNTGGAVVQADLIEAAGLQKLLSAVEKVAESVGGGIWALVNNAGIVLPGNVEWNPPAAYEKTMGINFHVPVNLTYALLPRIKKEKGRIMNVTSVDGFIALPSNAAYNASKHALEAYSDTLRMEMMPWGVNVIVVEPATMRTPLAMSYWDAWLKSYEDASEDRTPHGNAWARGVAAKGREALEAIAADPQITVFAMAEALVTKQPKIRYKTGKMAKFFFKPMSMLPHFIQDKLLMGMTFGTKPPALAQM
mmetsp:Transcript_68173/g.134635  ORF Transcript_68173/g.134635 Transcript_68173/m.134635 type:complete len:314 (+) Transcript_68173:57-998(+)